MERIRDVALRHNRPVHVVISENHDNRRQVYHRIKGLLEVDTRLVLKAYGHKSSLGSLLGRCRLRLDIILPPCSGWFSDELSLVVQVAKYFALGPPPFLLL